jgi:hypothetical protein
MSGQPYRYAKDVENFRNEYMESLGLRANIDNMNLQVNKNYKETGALPPQSSMKDMRTTSEILADTEKLKLSIISDFKDVATPNMMQIVLQKVQTSPLNGDGSFLIWMAQNSPELVSQLKKKYKFGIEGNANDAEQMYLFMQTIFSQTKDINSTVKTAFDRPTGSDKISVGEFPSLKKAYDDISLRLVSSPEVNNIKIKIKNQFNAIDNFILPIPPNNVSRYDAIKSIFNSVSQNASQIQQTAINNSGYKSLIEYTDKLPPPTQIRTILQQIQKSEGNSDNELTLKLLGNLSSLLPQINDTNEMIRVSDQIITSNGRSVTLPQPNLRPVVPPTQPPINAISPPTTQQTLIMRSLGNKISNMVDNYLSTYSPSGNNVTDDHAFGNAFLRDLNTIETEMDNLYPNWKQTINYDPQLVATAITNLTNQFDLAYSINQQLSGQQIRDEIKRIRGVNTDQMIGAGIKRVGRPKGSGIVKPLHERIDNTKGVKQGHTHVPFGKYIINKNRLDEDILSFKHNKGYGVKGYPAKKISRNLSNVLKVIVGGGVPKFDDLASLSENEKSYLHTVSKKAGITDKISVPTPSKDSMEQDIHQFEVMKGEILAGNDSSVLIKKFKLLLLKLSKNGTLPKREATEIMEDLIQLGY